VAGYSVTLDEVGQQAGPNYQALVGQLTVRDADGRFVTVLQPEKRTYTVQSMVTTEAAIRSTFWGDLYAVIEPAELLNRGQTAGSAAAASNPAQAWVVRLYFNPLVPWLWAGILMMAGGGAISLSDRRLRVGAPARRKQVAELRTEAGS
jgi:cytochrome c-type biogenesis protein CcmF